MGREPPGISRVPPPAPPEDDDDDDTDDDADERIDGTSSFSTSNVWLRLIIIIFRSLCKFCCHEEAMISWKKTITLEWSRMDHSFLSFSRWFICVNYYMVS